MRLTHGWMTATVQDAARGALCPIPPTAWSWQRQNLCSRGAGPSCSAVNGRGERPARLARNQHHGTMLRTLDMAIAAIFDTHKAVSMLEKRGLSKAPAEGITDLLKDVTESNLVTKNDLAGAVQDLKVEFERALHRQSWGLIGAMFAQAAFIIAILQYLS